MFSLFAYKSVIDHTNEEPLNHEWAEYNLPNAADIAILREQKTPAAECGALV